MKAKYVLLWLVILVWVGVASAAPARHGGFAYPPQMEGARAETYKTAGGAKLDLYIFAPAGASNAPAIVFFFGGGWSSGSPQQFDPGRIAAAGGSAGGHLAACTAFISGFDEPGEDQRVSAAPDALVLFNPALVLAPMEGLKLEGFGTRANEERLGTKAENLSPAHHVKPGAPPTLIFHGCADTTVPFVTAEAFAARMKAAGARCELVGYEGQAHGFFNREPWLTRTQAEADRFLASLGWISSK